MSKNFSKLVEKTFVGPGDLVHVKTQQGSDVRISEKVYMASASKSFSGPSSFPINLQGALESLSRFDAISINSYYKPSTGEAVTLGPGGDFSDLESALLHFKKEVSEFGDSPRPVASVSNSSKFRVIILNGYTIPGDLLDLGELDLSHVQVIGDTGVEQVPKTGGTLGRIILGYRSKSPVFSVGMDIGIESRGVVTILRPLGFLDLNGPIITSVKIQDMGSLQILEHEQDPSFPVNDRDSYACTIPKLELYSNSTLNFQSASPSGVVKVDKGYLRDNSEAWLQGVEGDLSAYDNAKVHIGPVPSTLVIRTNGCSSMSLEKCPPGTPHSITGLGALGSSTLIAESSTFPIGSSITVSGGSVCKVTGDLGGGSTLPSCYVEGGSKLILEGFAQAGAGGLISVALASRVLIKNCTGFTYSQALDTYTLDGIIVDGGGN